MGEAAELQNILTYGGSAALSYPVSIYTTWFRRVLTYGVPMAFVNYFPALAALGRTQDGGLAERHAVAVAAGLRGGDAPRHGELRARLEALRVGRAARRRA